MPIYYPILMEYPVLMELMEFYLHIIGMQGKCTILMKFNMLMEDTTLIANLMLRSISC